LSNAPNIFTSIDDFIAQFHHTAFNANQRCCLFVAIVVLLLFLLLFASSSECPAFLEQ